LVGDAKNTDAPVAISGGKIDEIARWLTANIGPRVIAYAAHTSRSEIARAAQGQGADPAVDERLRCIYAVVSYVAVSDGPGSAHDFLVEPNPDLDGRAPAELLHDGAPPEQVWLAAVPAF
jgi:hypothetical protein